MFGKIDKLLHQQVGVRPNPLVDKNKSLMSILPDFPIDKKIDLEHTFVLMMF
jgi:hypothetical protein